MRALLLLAIFACSACSRGSPATPRLALAGVQTPEARAEGRSLYLRNCALCHGDQADGHGLRSSGFERPPADLRRSEFHGAQAEARVLQALRVGLPGTPMPGWKDALTDGQLRALAAYVVNLEEASDVPGLWVW